MSDKNVSIDFSALDVAALPPKLVREAQVVWADRVRTEYQSIQIAARFLTEALAAGEPMDVGSRKSGHPRSGKFGHLKKGARHVETKG